jgi:glycosyltransferase involved in cell wall biosynthesis
MPVYNAGKYLNAAVESILNQTFADFEFLVLDDGSTDESPAIIQRYHQLDSRINVSQRTHENGNYATALNQLIEKARGEFIARMDADDCSRPERFEHQVAFLRGHPEVVAVSSRVLCVDRDLCPIRFLCTEQTHERIDEAHMQLRSGEMSHPAVMIRTDAIRRLNGYRVDYCPAEDFDLWLRLAEIGRLANLPEVLLSWRLHDKNVGHARHAAQLAMMRNAVRDAQLRRGLPVEEVRDEPISTPSPTPQSQLFRKWGWWALQAGHLGTAKKYALLTIKKKPFAKTSWQLLYGVLRAYRPGTESAETLL